MSAERSKFPPAPTLPFVTFPLSGDTTGVTDRAELTSLIGSLGAAGGVIQLPPGVTYVDQLSALSGTSGVWLRGAGEGATTLVFTSAGGIADLTDASFTTVSDMLIRPAVQRTAEFFHLDVSAQSCQKNRFLRLRVASPYRFATMLTCTTTTFDDIQFLDFNPAWTPNAGISLDGATTSTVLRGIRGGTAAGVTTALINIAGSTVDTVEGEDWDIVGLSGASMSGLSIAGGEWIRLANISIESGTVADAVTMSGAPKGVSMTGVHLLGRKGAYIKGGKGIEISKGEVVACQQEGIRVEAFSTIQDVDLEGLDISDTGLATTNTWAGVHFVGGFNYFRMRGCSSGNNRLLGSVNRNSYGCQIDAASDHYVITDNQLEGATATILDNGGGANKLVSNIG